MTSAFRILDQAPTYLDLLGNLCSGGYLAFYQAGTTTPANVYGDEALTVNLGPTVAIGTDGRTVTDVWGSGTYRVRLYTAANLLVFDRDNVQVPGGGLTIPALVNGYFLSTDGSVLIWQPVRQVPDPTGEAGKLVGSDGTNAIWQTLASLNIPTATLTAGKMVLGPFLIQWGIGSAPSSGTTTTSQAITFGQPYSATPAVMVQPTGVSSLSGAWSAIPTPLGPSASGFTAYFNSNSTIPGTGNFTSAQPFNWIALGAA